jgi:hypothetical protein
MPSAVSIHRIPAIGWLLAAFSLLGLAYAVVTPLFEISDELWHYPMVKTLADGNGLPVQDPAGVQAWRQEGSQPPLYYLVMAAATFWINTDDLEQVRWINPHTDNGLITADRNNNIAIHRPDEAGRWTGAALAVRLIRALSVLLGAATVYFTYRLALEIGPDQPILAPTAAALTAFTPMFIFISASVNNDNLAVTLSAATLWLLARWLRTPPGRLGWEHALLGALLGAGALSKQSALGLWALAGLTLAGATIFGRQTPNAGRRPSLVSRLSSGVTQSVIVFALAGLVCGWWYLRNYQLYGDWLGWDTFIAIVGPRPQPATLWQLWGERVGFVQAYWGLFGGVSVPMPGWTYTALNGAAGLALLGLGWGAARALRGRAAGTTAAQWGLLLAWIGLLFVGLVRWTSLTWASQGRLIFPAISAISLLIAAGLWALWPRLPVLLAAGMAGLAAAVPFTVIAPHYAPPPELTPAQIAAIPHRLDTDFGGELTLLGYDLRTPTAGPGGSVRLTLYWQSQIAMDRNWSIFVHLVDQDGILAAQRDRYPGQGLLATTLLRPGQTWADDYVIALPAGAYSPADLRVRAGVYDLADGVRLPVAAGGEWAEFGALALAGREVETRLGPVPNALRQNLGGQIELTGYTLDRRVLRAGEALTLTLYWRALGPIPANYSVSARVRGEDQARWAARDAWPQDGAAPTSSWRAGELLADPYPLTLDPATPPGQYFVEVVVYDPQTLVPLPLWSREGYPTDGQSVLLSGIRVTP